MLEPTFAVVTCFSNKFLARVHNANVVNYKSTVPFTSRSKIVSCVGTNCISHGSHEKCKSHAHRIGPGLRNLMLKSSRFGIDPFCTVSHEDGLFVNKINVCLYLSAPMLHKGVIILLITLTISYVT